MSHKCHIRVTFASHKCRNTAASPPHLRRISAAFPPHLRRISAAKRGATEILSQGGDKVAYATFETCICNFAKLHMRLCAVLPSIHLSPYEVSDGALRGLNTLVALSANTWNTETPWGHTPYNGDRPLTTSHTPRGLSPHALGTDPIYQATPPRIIGTGPKCQVSPCCAILLSRKRLIITGFLAVDKTLPHGTSRPASSPRFFEELCLVDHFLRTAAMSRIQRAASKAVRPRDSPSRSCRGAGAAT